LKDLPEVPQHSSKSRVKLPESLRYCNEILRELFNKRHSAYAWPFYKPVDAEALGLHDYHKIITNPMDLGTVKTKMDNRVYEEAEEFAGDVRQIFENCYHYNPDTHDVVGMARKLQEVISKFNCHILCCQFCIGLKGFF
jgi:hypothetical protein